MRMNDRAARRVAVMLAVAAFAASAWAQGVDTDVRVVPVQGNIYMITGAGSNITVQIGPPAAQRPRQPASAQERGEYGVLLVDTGAAGASDKVRAAIRTLSTEPIRYIISTHVHPDHVGGNAALGTPPAGRGGRGGGPMALILGHETVLARMSESEGDQPAAPQPAWPTDAYLDIKEFWFNDEALQVFHQPGHTDGDSVVFFRKSDVVSAGDVFVTTSYPVIDQKRGGSVSGVIAGLNRILDLTIVSNNAEGGTLVIPGHGRISDEADVVEYRNMVVMIRDRVQDLVKKGMTVEQVKAARPSLDYDTRYGKGPDGWNTDKFLEAVYSDVAKTVPKPAAGRPQPRSQGR